VLGAFVRYQSGSPLTKRFFNPFDGDYTDRRSPQGTEPGAGNAQNAIAEFRTPDTMEVDVRAAYDFHELLTPDGRHHLMLIADLFNLFDLGNAVGVEQRDLPTEEEDPCAAA
jgi:hypothetical protein